MPEATDKLYSEAYLTLLLRTVSSDGISPRLAVELALVLRHADQQIVPATLVIEFTQAVLTSVDPQRAINHLLRYLDNVPDIAAFWATAVQYPEAFVGMMRLFASSQFLSSILWRRPQLLFWLLEGALSARRRRQRSWPRSSRSSWPVQRRKARSPRFCGHSPSNTYCALGPVISVALRAWRKRLQTCRRWLTVSYRQASRLVYAG